MPDIALAVLILVPAAITFFLKSNAALSYLALCAGFVLSTSVIGDLKHLLSETNLSVTSDTLALVLLIAPYLLTLLVTRKVHEKGLFLYLNLIIALLGGGLLALSAGPLFGSSSNFDIVDSKFWTQLSNYQAAIIGAGAGLSLLMIWSGRHHKKH
ncbi:MAG TPA: hypothetical protein VFT49_04030 [Candidatus Saccharimonadales bacterium]|nr:hypothetical protein [Candidatus Saccharimonadales bacterium]